MLALDKQYGPFAGLSVFGDHADPSLFYWVPETPQLARRNGALELSLLEYKADPGGPGGAQGGGFLSFTVELAASPEQLTTVTGELQKLGFTSIVLQPVPFRNGTATLATVLDQAGPDGHQLVERVLGETTPALYGTQRAMFSLAMATADDVSLVAGMLTHAAVSPVGVRYDLRYDGLRPAIQAKITAKYDRVYHQLKQQFSAGASYYGVGLSVDLGWATQQLRENGDLQVEILEFTDDADLRARTEQVLQYFQDQLVTSFFRPSLPPPDPQALTAQIMAAAAAMGLSTAQAVLGNANAVSSIAKQLGMSPGTVGSVLGQGGGSSGAAAMTSNISFHLSYTFLDLNETEMKTETIDYSVAAAETRVAAPQGLLDALAPDDAAQCISQVVLGSNEFRNIQVHVQPTSDFASQGVDKMTVQLEYPASRPDGSAPSATGSMEIDTKHTDPQLFAVWVDAAGNLSFRYRLTLAFSVDSPWQGKEPTQQTDWITTMDRELVVSPLEYVSLIDLLVTPGLLSWTEVSEVQVDVRCGGASGLTQTLLLNQGAPNLHARFRRPQTGDATLQWRPTWFLASGARVAGAWVDVDSAQLLVDGPFHATRTIRLVPMLPPTFVDCSITLIYRENGYEHTEMATFLPGDTRVQTVTLRTFSDPFAPLDVRLYLTRQDLSTLDQTTQAVTAPAFVVADRAGAMRSIQVRLLAPVKFVDLKLSAVRVQLLDATDDSKVLDQLLFTQSQQDPLTWFIPVASADAPLQYRYRVIRYDLFGSPTTSAPVVSTDEQLILPAMAPPT